MEKSTFDIHARVQSGFFHIDTAFLINESEEGLLPSAAITV